MTNPRFANLCLTKWWKLATLPIIGPCVPSDRPMVDIMTPLICLAPTIPCLEKW